MEHLVGLVTQAKKALSRPQAATSPRSERHARERRENPRRASSGADKPRRRQENWIPIQTSLANQRHRKGDLQRAWPQTLHHSNPALAAHKHSKGHACSHPDSRLILILSAYLSLECGSRETKGLAVAGMLLGNENSATVKVYAKRDKGALNAVALEEWGRTSDA